MEMLDITNDPVHVVALTLDSINENATQIVINLDNIKKHIQIIDDGIGLSIHNFPDLQDDECDDNFQIKIRHYNLKIAFKQFARIFLTSKCQNSPITYTKIFEKGMIMLRNEEDRLMNGTTVSLCDYAMSPKSHNNIIYLTCLLIANISLNNPQITFVINDETYCYLKIEKYTDSVQTVKNIYGKYILDFVWIIPHITLLPIQYHGFMGFIKDKAQKMHYVYLNNKPVYCPQFVETILSFYTQNYYFLFHTRLDSANIFLLLFINCPLNDISFDIKENNITYKLNKIHELVNSIQLFIRDFFSQDIVKVQLHEYFKISVKYPMEADKSTICKVQNDLPLFFYEEDRLKNINKNKKSILFNTNINHNPMTVFFTRFGIFHYESIKQRSSIENYIINKEHLKTGTFVIKKPKLQNVDRNRNQGCFEKNIIFNISKNSTTKENVEYINRVNTSSIRTTVNAEQTLSSKQEDNIEKKTEDYNCSLFEWSDWSYHTNEMKNNEIKKQTTLSKLDKKNKSIEKYYKVFDFLPKKLNNLAQFKSIKLIKTPSFDNIDTSIFNELTCNYQENRKQHQDIDIHPCAFRQHFCEFKLQRTALEFTKVLNQVNKQLIAALMIYDNVELLLMMDQHAVHERIRYENLLNDYKTSDHKSFLTKKLPIPIILEVEIHMCTLLLSNNKSLDKYGIKLTAINENILSIYSIPKCFIINKQYYNDIKLITTIRSLLNEIADNITNGNGINILPLSIHNAVSMEACRGAIKFGQSLSVQECIELFNDLKVTKSPTRCAHGRPSIIPIIELSKLRRRYYKNMKVRSLFLLYTLYIFVPE